MKAALILALAQALQVSAWATVTHAQTSCRFVLGFADLAAQLGPAVVGSCIEDQWTATGPDVMNFNTGFTSEGRQ